MLETSAHVTFIFILLNFAFADKLGIIPVDLGLMCMSLCGHRTRLTRKRRKMTTVFANCVATVLVIYQSVGIAT